MSEKKPKEEHTQFPPKIPEDIKELEHAIMLLGNRIKVAGLGAPARAALERLIGASPSTPQAQVWKITLSKLRRQRLGISKAKTPGEEA